MDSIESFFSPLSHSLKICGVTLASDAEQLVSLQVPALGINFWPQSKRYCPPEEAVVFLPALAEQIVRVGVFVNNARENWSLLSRENAIDIIQLHGDEDDEELRFFLNQGIPVIRSLALQPDADLAQVSSHYQEISQSCLGSLALLLDAHAPGVYGGTGETIDWVQAAGFIQQCAPLPVLLAGGITPTNAQEAVEVTRAAALDVASGAESSPGKKDFAKVMALQSATQTAPVKP